ncbi:MAG: hypothetical protein JXR77_18840, partial [Lentisphaeria bacterium]|nr:hypothetical protein [Lentisphaeria bacterium]
RWQAATAAAVQTVRVLARPAESVQGGNGEAMGMARHGGWRGRRGTSTGFFHVERMAERWWLVDPEGWGFLSLGVNGVNEQGTASPALGYSPYRRTVQAAYEDDAAWAATAVSRLRVWGFNTLGAWSSALVESAGMPYCHILDIGRRATGQSLTRPPRGGAPWAWFPDVFGAAFEEGARRVAREACGPRRDDPCLVGYFLDNEFRWDGLWQAAFASAPDSPCRDALVACARRVFPSADALREAGAAAGIPALSSADLRQMAEPPARGLEALREAWLETVAERYFSVCTAAVREADPNHMVISQRFAGHAPDWAARAAGRHCDVFCINYYNDGIAYGVSDGLRDRFRELGEITGRPVLVGEWSFKAMDSGLPNTRGAATPVETQQDRAVGYASTLAVLLDNPHVVGAHWFIHSDQPLEGRFDGENSNYGLVDLADRPYGPLVVTAAFMNRFAYVLADGAAFGKARVEILPEGPAWVRLESDELAVNSASPQPCRFSASHRRAGVGERRLRIGVAETGTQRAAEAAFAWAGAQPLVGSAHPRGRSAGYQIREGGPGGSVLDRDRQLPVDAEPRGFGASPARPFLEADPYLDIRPGESVPTILTVRNPTPRPLAGDLVLEANSGWTLDALPALDVPPGGSQEIRAMLAAAAETLPYARLVIREPFADVVVFRVGLPADLVAVSSGEGVAVLLRKRVGFAGEGFLDVVSEPLLLTGAARVDGSPGLAGPWPLTGTPDPAAPAVALRAVLKRPGMPLLELHTYCYRFRDAGDWRGTGGVEPETSRGPHGEPCLGLSRATPGTTECHLPAVPVPPAGQALSVRLAAQWDQVVRGGTQSWHRANVAVYFEDAEGNYVSHVDVLLDHGSRDWTRFERLVHVPRSAARFQIRARLLECTGSLRVAAVRVVALPPDLSRDLR